MDTYGYGSYVASIKAARAPFSITGIFPYAPPDFHTKIGVEIFNDESGRALFTTYADGEQTNIVEKRLPFDATAAFHEYSIDLYPTRAEFSVDGRPLHTFEEGLPGDLMKLSERVVPGVAAGREARIRRLYLRGLDLAIRARVPSVFGDGAYGSDYFCTQLPLSLFSYFCSTALHATRWARLSSPY